MGILFDEVGLELLGSNGGISLLYQIVEGLRVELDLLYKLLLLFTDILLGLNC